MIKPIGTRGLERLELLRLRDRVGRLFSTLQEATVAEEPLASGAWAPPVDLCEARDAIYIRAELPGVKADQIKVGLTNTQLRICGEKKRRVARNRITSHFCSERSYGKFSRIVPLRWTVNVRKATAQLSNGILLIRVPKIEDRRGTEIKLTVTEGTE